jgi:hypothetical protein
MSLFIPSSTTSSPVSAANPVGSAAATQHMRDVAEQVAGVFVKLSMHVNKDKEALLMLNDFVQFANQQQKANYMGFKSRFERLNSRRAQDLCSSQLILDFVRLSGYTPIFFGDSQDIEDIEEIQQMRKEIERIDTIAGQVVEAMGLQSMEKDIEAAEIFGDFSRFAQAGVKAEFTAVKKRYAQLQARHADPQLIVQFVQLSGYRMEELRETNVAANENSSTVDKQVQPPVSSYTICVLS